MFWMFLVEMFLGGLCFEAFDFVIFFGFCREIQGCLRVAFVGCFGYRDFSGYALNFCLYEFLFFGL